LRIFDYVLKLGCGKRSGLPEDSDAGDTGDYLFQEVDALRSQLWVALHRPREIPTGPLEAVRQAEGNRISPEQEDDRDCTRGVPCLAGRWPRGDDKINAHPHEVGSKLREPLSLALCVSVLNGNVLTFDPTEVA
jgi:hypothetical protein